MPKQVIRYENPLPDVIMMPTNLLRDVLVSLPATSALRRQLSAIYKAQVAEYQSKLPKKNPNPTKWPTRAERLAKLEQEQE